MPGLFSFGWNDPFERSRWMLFGVLLIQLVVTVIIAGEYEEKVALGLVGAVSVVAVLTKRPWYTTSTGGRVAIFSLLAALTIVAAVCTIGAFATELSDGAITGNFTIWLAPLAAAVIAVFDFYSSVKAPTVP